MGGEVLTSESMMQPHMLTSSSAKADDPVFGDADELSATAAITGYPLSRV
jgi:hypothetical protein